MWILSKLLSQTNHQKQGDIVAICSHFVGDKNLQLMWSALQKNQEIALNATADYTWEASSYFAIWVPAHPQGIPKRENTASTDDWTLSW